MRRGPPPRFVLHGCSLEVLPRLLATGLQVDAVVTDPPYELGFMGKHWDASGIAYRVDLWAEVLRVLKPGGHLLAFGGTRTYHRMTCAIEDAGFEVRDSLHWMYGTGFPKSLSVGKAIAEAAGATREVVGKGKGRTGQAAQPNGSSFSDDGYKWPGEFNVTAPATDAARQWEGWGTALKPAHEPIVLARKPLEGTVAANVLRYGTGALNVDACRVGAWSEFDKRNMAVSSRGKPGMFGLEGNGGDALEPNRQGRWPANVLLDESAAAELDAQSGTLRARGNKTAKVQEIKSSPVGMLAGMQRFENGNPGDSGGASRFFYVAKPSRKERGAGNTHPTVKPVQLLRYLVRLVTPPGGMVLDPFAGSGTTGVACALEGFAFVGVEAEKMYVRLAERRIAQAV